MPEDPIMKDAIGGYFGAEHNKGGQEIHPEAIKLNTGRNALEYALRATRVSRIHLPHFICGVVMEPIEKLGLDVSFYHVNEKLEPVNIPQCKPGESLLYPVYFGLKNTYAASLVNHCDNLILDASQALFFTPPPKASTFYSLRKFFGSPDGAFLYTSNQLSDEFTVDDSSNRTAHLTLRKENGAEAGYEAFRENEQALCQQPIRLMSPTTQSIARGLNADLAIETRRRNFMLYHAALGSINELSIPLEPEAVPMSYPFMTQNAATVRERLHAKRTYTATYWTDVPAAHEMNEFETRLVANTVHLPLDHRIGEPEIASVVKEVLNPHMGH